MKNKSGWIKIVEAFMMILLITGFILVMLNKGQVYFSGNSPGIYEKEQAILHDIQMNDSLRSTIINSAVPLDWSGFPNDLKSKINQSSTLDCTGKLCAISGECVLSNPQNSANLYVQSVIITTNLNTYSPRKLKIFCYEK